jgi:hypothetical protein
MYLGPSNRVPFSCPASFNREMKRRMRVRPRSPSKPEIACLRSLGSKKRPTLRSQE